MKRFVRLLSATSLALFLFLNSGTGVQAQTISSSQPSTGVITYSVSDPGDGGGGSACAHYWIPKFTTISIYSHGSYRDVPIVDYYYCEFCGVHR